MERSSGILLPIFSLPSQYGIGTLGREAYRFADFLADAGQSWWQLLPMGPTGFGDSPYQSFSSFAGNPYFIDPDALADEGLLTHTEIWRLNWGNEPERIDYGLLYQNRSALLKTAADAVPEKYAAEIDVFRRENADWLPDYALFMALKEHYGGRPWQEWPAPLRSRDAGALAAAAAELADSVNFHVCCQFLFFRQYASLRAYARKRGVKLIGDLPIYAAADSADVWAAQELFCLDGRGYPAECAGVPPDYFSEDGQLWGNPLYHWDAMASDGYAWWRRRVQAASKLYDMLRMDHFRGFESYWTVPAGADTAKNGEWRKGPGLPFLRTLEASCPELAFIAEDLGLLTEAVEALRSSSGWPGMAVLQFAFDAGGESSYLPDRIGVNTVCYVGTHDNLPLQEWWDGLPEDDRRFALRFLGLADENGYRAAILRSGMDSDAELFISRLQDWFDDDGGTGINTPGTNAGNWRWRLTPDALTDALAERIHTLTCVSNRQQNTKCC